MEASMMGSWCGCSWFSEGFLCCVLLRRSSGQGSWLSNKIQPSELVRNTSIKSLHRSLHTSLVSTVARICPSLRLRICIIEGLSAADVVRGIKCLTGCVVEWSKRRGVSFRAVRANHESSIAGWFVDVVAGGIKSLPDCEEAVHISASLRSDC
jgi:hypothetical protein